MAHGRIWDGEWCRRCNWRNVMGWSVPNVVWKKVVRGRWSVLCPSCFDELAEEAGIRYKFDLAVYPVTWNDWE